MPRIPLRLGSEGSALLLAVLSRERVAGIEPHRRRRTSPYSAISVLPTCSAAPEDLLPSPRPRRRRLRQRDPDATVVVRLTARCFRANARTQGPQKQPGPRGGFGARRPRPGRQWRGGAGGGLPGPRAGHVLARPSAPAGAASRRRWQTRPADPARGRSTSSLGLRAGSLRVVAGEVAQAGPRRWPSTSAASAASAWCSPST